MRRPRNRAVLIRRVNFWWYPLALLPILALLTATALGWLPPLVLLPALFLLFFWLSSLGFALYARFRKPKEPRQ